MTDLPVRNLVELRRMRLERTGAYPIHSEEEALSFLEDVGYCRFSHHGDSDLPCFTDCLAPEVQDQFWAWKDSLPNTRRVYYGAIFKFNQKDSIRPGFLSLPVLAGYYALAPIMQFGGEADQLPRWTGLSREALGLLQMLENSGALTTGALRKATGLNGKEHDTRFHKALIEAQANFLLVRTGVTSTTRGNYGYVWESFARAYPGIVSQAEALSEVQAAERLVSRYIDTALEATLERIAFVLSLDVKLLRSAASRLVENGRLAYGEGGVYSAIIDRPGLDT